MLEGRWRKEKKELERRKESSLKSSDSGGREGEDSHKEPSPPYRYLLELKSTPTIPKGEEEDLMLVGYSHA